jgi:hypothetical protein
MGRVTGKRGRLWGVGIGGYIWVVSLPQGYVNGIQYVFLFCIWKCLLVGWLIVWFRAPLMEHTK